jgi:cytoskeleton protein RodZ
MTLPTVNIDPIGQRLREARLARGLSIEDAAHATHIRASYLQALEEGNFSALPSAVQGRGFLRSYSNYLGITVLPEIQPTALLEKIPVEETLPGSSISTSFPIQPADRGSPASQVPDRKASIFKRGLLRKNNQLETTSNPPIKGSRLIFTEIGQTLRERREALGLSLADIEQYTRLRLHYLEALETGSVDELPSPVQGKGMLSNYAHFLNLDADALLLRYADGLQAYRIENIGPRAPSQHQVQNVSYPPFRRIVSLDMVVGILLVITLAVFLFWGISQVTSEQEKALAVSTLPAVADVLGNSYPSTSTPAAQNTQTTTGSAAAEITTKPAVTIFPENTAPIQVYVVALYQAWVKVTADGKVIYEGRMLPGTAYPFAGTQQVELLTGNAAALQVFFNKEDIGSLGVIGEVVNIVFTPEGLVQPTATITPTATQSPTASPTEEISGTPSASRTPTQNP